MLSAPICRLRGVNSILFSSILMVILLANTVDPDQTPHYTYVASDLGLHRLPLTLYGFSGKIRVSGILYTLNVA